VPAHAEELVEVYFGCGCFWHVQHEFVMAERAILGRGDSEFTSFVGYAGGKAGAKDGKVCYHNALMQSDYGSLGHAEVVRLMVPPSKFGLIAEEYCKLFSKAGERPDQYGDRGREYRNVVGLPGGVQSPMAQELVEASKRQGDKLNFAKGKGDDSDTKGMVFIMDTGKFPFFLGEPYHQFHDGFAQGEDYPDTYNQLGVQYVQAGRISNAGCPNGLMGLGFGGL
jgi:peptide methionine sulfoxide reductase MsrA